MSTRLWLVPLGYLVGSIPFGLLMAKASSGVDVRRVGSGNIGATNVLRAAGKGAAAITLALDMLKGWAPVALSQALGTPGALVACVALATFLGHLYPVYLGFRGGKGVATFLGVMWALSAKVAFLIIAIWLFIAALFRYSSLAALVASAASPLLIWLVDGRPLYVILTLILFAFILVRHRENLLRLRAGEEGKIGQRVQGARVDPPRRDRFAS
ncbi:MAG: glycerol-3-phosphate 1-O-acyltransferase PlsY [candidate division NC10 bacterium]|nr:glycerol-3-phosphate 1-O-acyltransferase PlsY [candidate division NC10 bacterium]